MVGNEGDLDADTYGARCWDTLVNSGRRRAQKVRREVEEEIASWLEAEANRLGHHMRDLERQSAYRHRDTIAALRAEQSILRERAVAIRLGHARSGQVQQTS